MTRRAAGRTTARDLPTRWILDSLQHGGHTHADILAFSDFMDQEEEVRVRRDRGGVVAPTAGMDLGPRRRGRGLWGLLFGGR